MKSSLVELAQDHVLFAIQAMIFAEATICNWDTGEIFFSQLVFEKFPLRSVVTTWLSNVWLGRRS
jgi:hypothetical protein